MPWKHDGRGILLSRCRASGDMTRGPKRDDSVRGENTGIARKKRAYRKSDIAVFNQPAADTAERPK